MSPERGNKDSTEGANFSLVVFDMDGLLLDTERVGRTCWQAAARESGFTLTDEMYAAVVGRVIEDAKRIFQEFLGPHFDFNRIRERRIELSKAYYVEHGVSVKRGAKELLQALKDREIPCALATSTRRKEAEQKLEQSALLPYFLGTACGDEVSHGKPAPDLFLLAAKRAGVATARAVVLEDSPFGIQAAAAAGMKSIFVPDLVPPNDTVRELSLVVVPSLVEAQSYILA